MRLHHQTDALYRLAHQLSKKLRMSTVSRDFVGSNRVLSIQSHPVFGYVGNKAAVFPMQVLGMDVDPIHTVVLSNHGGYPSTRGEQTSSHVLSDIITGLQENNLLNYDYILTGYTRSHETLDVIYDAICKVKATNSNMKYICDPVLGDNGRFYVPESLLSIYESRFLPLADLLTPNQFECEVLTGIQINTEADAIRACSVLHSKGVRSVLLKGLMFRDSHRQQQQQLSMIASDGQSVHRIDLEQFEGKFHGCGDLCAALAVAWLHRSNGNLPVVLEKVSATIRHVIHTTVSRRAKELQLIPCHDVIAEGGVNSNDDNRDNNSNEHRISDDNRAEHRRWRGAYRISGGIRAVIFDLDGTLTLPGHIDFSRMRSRVGVTRQQGVDLLTQVLQLSSLEAREAAMGVIYEEEMIGAERMEMQPCMHHMLTGLEDRRLRLAIATRNNPDAVQVFLQQAGLANNHFHPILTRYFEHNKPSPKVAQHIIEQWGVAPEQVLFVGDSRDDMLCGKQAGCRTCFVTSVDGDDACNDDELVDFRISNLQDILAIVDGVNIVEK